MSVHSEVEGRAADAGHNSQRYSHCPDTREGVTGVTIRESPGNASKGSRVGIHSSLESNFFLTNVCLVRRALSV